MQSGTVILQKLHSYSEEIHQNMQLVHKLPCNNTVTKGKFEAKKIR
jgi:hypothetical protein